MKCSRVETPKPTASGASVAERILDISSPNELDTEADTPVVPRRDTTYINASASEDK